MNALLALKRSWVCAHAAACAPSVMTGVPVSHSLSTAPAAFQASKLPMALSLEQPLPQALCAKERRMQARGTRPWTTLA
jgi:hypothetical protein